MAEESAKGRVPGWLKAGGTSVFGLVSGAVLMYLTPLVNSAIKPPEPVANFGFQAQGLAVTFQNRSTNATDGWWDFGDGSALEPFAPQQPTIAHTYAKPDSYLVKLSLTNVFNEKSDRTVTVKLDSASAAAPVIDKFEVAPLTPGMTAPAVFRLVAQVKNAEQLIWCCGDTKPIEVSTETGGVLERWVTIEDPGYHRFRVVAVGSKTVEKISEPVFVGAAPSGNVPTATVIVSYDAVRVDRQEKETYVRLPWKVDWRENICPVVAEWLPKPGYHVVKAELKADSKDARVRGTPRVDVAPDGSKVIVSADLIRPTNVLEKLIPVHHVHLNVTLEQRTPPTTKDFVVPMSLNMTGQTIIPIPAPSGHWQATKRKMTLELKEGQRRIWSGSDMPVNRPLQLQGHTVVVSASVQNNQVVLTVTNPQVGLPPVGN